MSSAANVCGMRTPIISRLILALLLLSPVYSFPQAGTPPKDTHPPGQSPQGSGSGKSSGGVGTGVSVDVGEVLHQVFKKKHKIKLEATPAQVQAGQPVTVNASVSPAKPELQYVFQWSKDLPGEQKDTSTAAHTYTSPGQYQVRVVVFEKGKKLAVSDELAIMVVPAAPGAVVAGVSAPLVAIKPAPPGEEAKAVPPAAEPVTTPAPSATVPAKAPDDVHASEPTGDTKPQPEIAKQSPAPAKTATPAGKSDQDSVPVIAAPGKKPATSADIGVLGATDKPSDNNSSLHLGGRTKAGKPGLWTGTWAVAAILLILLVGIHTLRRLRKVARAGVIARVDAGRHTINTEGPIAGAPFRIRCVPSTIHSTVTVASADNRKEAAHA
ncbi:MAG: hypothetical protein DMG65_18220 [Candidatus Angelobacter sp. Gp1-AA117]|nr:MAG: hypothetical protein DMG65_18220 [Candidatus Angelobacter sp. Gp1-AA117]